MYVLLWRTISALTRGLFCCLFPDLLSKEGNKHQTNTRVSAETVRYESTYIIFNFLHDKTDPKMMIKTTIFTHHPRVSLARFSFSCWRHNRMLMRSLWPDSCDAITWIMISSSLDIDFIHGDIPRRPCKNKHFVIIFYLYSAPNPNQRQGLVRVDNTTLRVCNYFQI